ncbi:Fur family transcriptional regulator [Agromyces bauzanensis]|uniref:Transcriptional repressor n=1 Tax=Agromyces bauzanensis TaxID=1308924 RepID=A0A917PEX8_9MICO|nr:Fur family transcriptional regulator [Agromyces bauzanensis]GGJ73810.1 transcriptional repressor [Agromyces bauzanensis]
MSTSDVTASATAPHGDGVLAHTLRDVGLKVTAPRLAALLALAEHPHADADTVFRAVQAELPTTSLQAVYGVLGAFADAGLVRRIEPAGSPALYERRVGDNHHHLVCRDCGRVEDVDCVVGESACLTPSSTHGFQVAEAEVTFWGRCPACAAAAAAVAEPT